MASQSLLAALCLSLGIANFAAPNLRPDPYPIALNCQGCDASAWHVINIPAGPGAGRVFHEPIQEHGVCQCVRGETGVILPCYEVVDCSAIARIDETLGGSGGTLPINTVGPPDRSE
jgi:hypothetical protein